MKSMRRYVNIGSLLVGLTAGLGAGVLIMSGAGPAEAQNAANNNAAQTTITYTYRFIDQVTPTNSEVTFKEIIPFPGAPIFLYRTNKGITVWERTGNRMRTIQEIPLNSDFKEVVFLDDNETFLIRTKDATGVFTIRRNVTVTAQQRR